jgi:hypothetical protein
MSLRFESLLACFINTRGGLGATYSPTHRHVKTLTATSSRSDPKALVACEVLAYPCATFHLCTCGLRGGATALIGYDDLGLLSR